MTSVKIGVSRNRIAESYVSGGQGTRELVGRAVWSQDLSLRPESVTIYLDCGLTAKMICADALQVDADASERFDDHLHGPDVHRALQLISDQRNLCQTRLAAIDELALGMLPEPPRP